MFFFKEKGNGVLGIQIKCPKHDWQRTVYIKNGIGCSYCYEKTLSATPTT